MNFYKLFMNPIFMKFVGGYPSTIWMIKKNRKSVAWHFSLGFSIFAIVNLSVLSFLYRMFYLVKWHETFTVVFW